MIVILKYLSKGIFIMEYKILDEKDIALMQHFVDDENTKYEEENLMNFIKIPK